MNRSVVICIGLSALLLIVGCDRATENQNNSIVSLHSELGGNASGYDRACGAREFSFPEDHGAHPSFRNEWWYLTGNVTSEHHVNIGFHVTFFRVANVPGQPDSQSSWAATQFYMAHFAISVEGRQRVRAHERFARSAADLAGAVQQSAATRIWLDDWVLENSSEGVWTINLAEGEERLSLTLIAEKPEVLQGEAGYSRKSADPCNSSYYYSLPRMQTRGAITVENETHKVNGTAWLDREWSSSALADDQVGWDWFAMQLDDGRDLMFYQLRNANGRADPFSHAVEINRAGVSQIIPAPELEITNWWQSPSGARYPIAGKLHRRDNNEVLVFEPLLENQELLLTVRYWEGAIRLKNRRGESIGRGYLELTGY